MVGRVWILSNVYDKSEEEENKRSKRIMKWRFNEETEKEFERLGIKKEQVPTPIIASRAQKYQLLTPEGLILPYSGMVAKGCAIRNNFHFIRKNFDLKDDDMVIYLDGDGQVNPNEVFKVVKALAGCNLVLTNRGKNSGIPDERRLIEKFENSIIENKFSVKLVDAQSGCWGLTGKVLNEIYDSLDATGFEIELDILISSLEKGINPTFVNIDIKSPEVQSNFEVGKDDIKKLTYLMKKFKLTQEDILEKSQIFAKEETPLPLAYTKIFTYDEIKRTSSEIKRAAPN